MGKNHVNERRWCEFETTLSLWPHRDSSESLFRIFFRWIFNFDKKMPPMVIIGLYPGWITGRTAQKKVQRKSTKIAVCIRTAYTNWKYGGYFSPQINSLVRFGRVGSVIFGHFWTFGRPSVRLFYILSIYLTIWLLNIQCIYLTDMDCGSGDVNDTYYSIYIGHSWSAIRGKWLLTTFHCCWLLLTTRH